MEPSKSTKTLVEDTLGGYFRDVHNRIVRNDPRLETPSAIKVLVAVCTACHKNLTNIDPSDLIGLVKCLLKSIRAPNDEQFERYSQSTFFILKFFIDKKNFDCIMQLEQLLLPDFMPSKMTPKQHSLYLNICKSVYNLIASVSQTKDRTHTKNVLNLCHLVLRIYRKLTKDDPWFGFVYNCVPALTTLNAPPEELVSFFQNLIQATELLENPSVYVLIVKNFSIVYTHLLENEQLEKATSCYKSTQAHLSRVRGSENGLLSDIMSAVEWFNPNNFSTVTRQAINAADSHLKKYDRLFKSTPRLQAVCDLISSVGATALILYKKTNLWQKTEINSSCYQFLHNVSRIVEKTRTSCSCKCPTQRNLYGAALLLDTITRLGRLNILNQNEVSWEYTKEVLFYLEKFSEIVRGLKAAGCQKWEKLWYDLGVPLYSIGVHLYQKKDRMSLSYLEKFVSDFFDLEGFESKIMDRVYLKCALNTIGDIHLDDKSYDRCLLVTALVIILSESSKSEMNRWIKAKASSRNDDTNSEMQEWTLVSITRKFRKDPILIKSGITLSVQRKVELLRYELTQYQSKWKSKIPMMAAFKELAQIASSQVTAEVLIAMWGDGEMAAHENLAKLLLETIRRVEAEKVARKELILAHLYFLRHRYRLKDTVLKHCDEMEKTMAIGKDNGAVVAMAPPDPDDECDIVSSYESLKLSRYSVMMKELDKSLSLVNDWVLKGTTDGVDVDRLFKLLSNIGHEYGLHGHTIKALQAWELALRVSTNANNVIYRLQATGFIIELADVRRVSVQKMMVEAEEGITILKTNNKFDELITYYLCKADAYLFVDFKVAYSSFQEVLDLQKVHQCGDILLTRIHLQHHKFMMMPCHYGVAGHQEFSLVKIHQANYCANAHYSQAQFLSSYDMRVWFEVYENLARMYYDLHQPREVRCYAKDAVLIAQKMILPFRTMTLLYYLAHADVTTHRLDDARVKIKDFSDILCLDEGGINPVEHKQDNRGNLEVLIEEFGEMMLDRRVPQSTCSGSPNFAVETFRLSSFLTHEDECECLYCTSLEYQELVLRVTFLKALLRHYEGNLSVSRDFFNGCLKTYECLKHRDASYARKTLARVSSGLVPTLVDKLVEIRCVALLEYGNFLIRNRRLADAETINRRVTEKLESSSSQVKLVYLYNKVLYQTIAIRCLQEEEASTDSNFLPVEAQETSMKTPPARHNTVVLSPNWTVEPLKGKVFAKSLKFDLEDEDDPKVANNKRVQGRDLPFLNMGAATPAPSSSKIKIYTSGSTKRGRAPPPEPTPFKEPPATNPGTTEKKTNPNLALRTKLLTERLKDSSRKESKKTEDGAKRGAKDRVKQNLLQQLDELDTKTKAVRRSARNVK